MGEDGIEEGDQLLKIGNVDVSQMPLVRGKTHNSYCALQITIISIIQINNCIALFTVAQRMNDFRIPPGSRVKLTFGRKVLREEIDEEVCFSFLIRDVFPFL